MQFSPRALTFQQKTFLEASRLRLKTPSKRPTSMRTALATLVELGSRTT